jgi:hypothetical protein
VPPRSSDFDVPVLLAVRNALDHSLEDEPPQLVGAAEQRRAELGAGVLEPRHGGKLDLLVGLPVHPAEFFAEATLLLRKPVDRLPDDRGIDAVVETVELRQLLLVKVVELSLQPGPVLQARLLSVAATSPGSQVVRSCHDGVRDAISVADLPQRTKARTADVVERPKLERAQPTLRCGEGRQVRRLLGLQVVSGRAALQVPFRSPE